MAPRSEPAPGSAPPARRYAVALATSAAYALLDADGPAFTAALRAVGIDSQRVIWDDAAIDWAAYDAVVVRSTWDYIDDLPRFLGWLQRPRRVINPAAVIRWNADKGYLADLAAAGLPVVPTYYLAPAAAGPAWRDGGPAAWTQLVVKPAVSGSAKDTARFERADRRADALIARIHARGATAMIQPYLPQVARRGEASLVYFAGRYSHAARKSPILLAAGVDGAIPGDDAGVLPTEPEPEQRRIGDAVLAHLQERFGAPCYARVDLLPSRTGPVVLEVELIEPNLWLFAPGAATRFAAAVRSHLDGADGGPA